MQQYNYVKSIAVIRQYAGQKMNIKNNLKVTKLYHAEKLEA